MSESEREREEQNVCGLPFGWPGSVCRWCGVTLLCSTTTNNNKNRVEIILNENQI